MPLLYESFPFPKRFSQVKDSQQSLVIIAAYPSSTLQLVDILTGKPIIGALVVADSKEYTSDSSGNVALDLPSGTYTISISNPNYLAKKLTLTLPMTEPLTVKLIPAWGVALGIVATSCLVVGIGAKIAWRK